MEITDEATRKRLIDALIKKAVGYVCSECTDEYSLVEGELAATKRKEVTKDVAPDVAAIKMLLEMGEEPHYSEDELERELKRYLDMLKNTIKPKKGD